MARDLSCITKINEGRWEIRIRYVDRLTGLARIYKKRLRGTVDDAVAARDAAKVELRTGQSIDADRPRLGQSLSSYLKPWLKDRATRGKGGRPLSRNTLEKDITVLKCSILSEAGDWIAGAIRRRDVEDLVARWATWSRVVLVRDETTGVVVRDEDGEPLRETALYSAESVNTWLRVMRVYMRWIYETEELGPSPVEDVAGLVDTEARQPKRRKTVLTIKQMQALLAVLRRDYSHYYPIFVLILTTGGARVGEVTALHWDDIDEEQELIHLRHNQTRGNRGDTKMHITEVHALPQSVAEILRAHRRHLIATEHPGVASGIVFPAAIDPGEAVCHGYMQRWTLNGILERACEKADVPRITPHRFRDFVNTRLTARGLHPTIIQALTGHATDAMTVHYSHISPEDKAAHLWPLLEELALK